MTFSLRPSRWFRFGLKTLFVLVTLVGGWLGWQLHVVHRRLALLEELRQSGVAYVPVRWHDQWINAELDWLCSADVTFVREAEDARGPSWIRMRMGDCYVHWLGFDRQLTDADRRAIAAFPEARIQARP